MPSYPKRQVKYKNTQIIDKSFTNSNNNYNKNINNNNKSLILQHKKATYIYIKYNND